MKSFFIHILSSLIGCVIDTGQKRLRIKVYNIDTLTPIHCGSLEDFEINLNRAIIISDNAYTLRVNINNYSYGEGLEHCNCGVPKVIHEMLNSIFGEDENGDVYVNIANVSDNTGKITITKIIL